MAMEPTKLSNYDAVGAMAPRPLGVPDEDGVLVPVDADNPLPVEIVGGGGGGGGLTDAQLRASAVPVSLAGAATEATLAAASAKLPASLGGKAAAASLSVTSSTEDAALMGGLTETAPASDTASSGQNGRLQRIAQRLTSLIALLPASLGAKAHGASLSVASAGLEYETVAASATAQTLGATGATGDFLSHVIIQPTTTGAGTVTILDNATAIFTFTTGTLGDLRPIIVPINAFSVTGAWKITTGAAVTATGFGDFT